MAIIDKSTNTTTYMRREVSRITQIKKNVHALLAKGCTTLVRRTVQ